MKVKGLIRAAGLGAVLGYLWDPVLGRQRRAIVKHRVSAFTGGVRGAVGAARPTVQHAAEVAKDQVEGAVRTFRNWRGEAAEFDLEYERAAQAAAAQAMN